MDNENKLNYMIAEIEGKTIFFHEAMWALHNGLIPDGKLVYHIDGNPMNNDISNLALVDENKDYGDLHLNSNKIFHKSSYDKEFVKKHFTDVYDTIENVPDLVEVD